MTSQRHNTENSKQIFPEKELRGYIHVSLSDLYIPLIGLPIFFCGKIGRPNMGISLTDT
jgi:hypothetical protein